MATSNKTKKDQSIVPVSQMTPGMIITVGKSLHQVESSVKVAVKKGASFIKAKLRDLNSGKTSEKNYQLDQTVHEVVLEQKDLEFLYIEGTQFCFLDIDSLEHLQIDKAVIGNAALFLKEGVQLIASFYGDTVFSIELPPFLELAVASTEEPTKKEGAGSNGMKKAVLETGAKVEIPSFVEVGDIVKIDTRSCEYIQRV